MWQGHTDLRKVHYTVINTIYISLCGAVIIELTDNQLIMGIDLILFS